MSAVMTIDHMSQLVDALDRQDFPALLLERLEALVPFDLYAVFFRRGIRAGSSHSNFPSGAPERSHRYSGGTFRYHPFFQHHLGHRKRRPFPARAVPLALPAPARARLRQHPAEPRRRDRLSDPGLSATLKELDLSVRLAGSRTCRACTAKAGAVHPRRGRPARLSRAKPRSSA